MRQNDLELLLNRRPCPRLRLHVTNGLAFDVDDPELTVVGRSAVEIGLPPGDGLEREAVISLLHIIWVEVLPPAS